MSRGISTDKARGTVAVENTTTLTTGFGTIAATGWISKEMDCRKARSGRLRLIYTHKSAGAPATLLSLQFLFGDAGGTVDADYCEEVVQNSAGTLSDVPDMTLDTTGLANDEVWTRELEVNLEKVAGLRVAAKVDVATDSPTLTLEYLLTTEGKALAATPSVA